MGSCVCVLYHKAGPVLWRAVVKRQSLDRDKGNSGRLTLLVIGSCNNLKHQRKRFAIEFCTYRYDNSGRLLNVPFGIDVIWLFPRYLFSNEKNKKK